MPKLAGANRVRFSPEEIELHNLHWNAKNPDIPSKPRHTRSYWFTFGQDRDCIVDDVPDHDECDAATALCEAARAWLFDGQWPEGLPDTRGGAARELQEAASGVLATWAHGDLAGAVRRLGVALAACEATVPQPRRVATARALPNRGSNQ